MGKDKFEEAMNGNGECWSKTVSAIEDVEYYVNLCKDIKHHIGAEPEKHPTNMRFMKEMVGIIHDISGKLLEKKEC